MRIAVYGSSSIASSGILANLRFSDIGSTGSNSQLSFAGLLFNEGDPIAIGSSGKVTVTHQLRARSRNEGAEKNGAMRKRRRMTLRFCNRNQTLACSRSVRVTIARAFLTFFSVFNQSWGGRFLFVAHVLFAIRITQSPRLHEPWLTTALFILANLPQFTISDLLGVPPVRGEPAHALVLIFISIPWWAYGCAAEYAIRSRLCFNHPSLFKRGSAFSRRG